MEKNDFQEEKLNQFYTEYEEYFGHIDEEEIIDELKKEENEMCEYDFQEEIELRKIETIISQNRKDKETKDMTPLEILEFSQLYGTLIELKNEKKRVIQEYIEYLLHLDNDDFKNNKDHIENEILENIHNTPQNEELSLKTKILVHKYNIIKELES